MHRYTYPDAYARVGQLANALQDMGIEQGDRVATLAWNGYRHFELYYAVSGMGAVCHTINPRLSAEQMVYIIQHAEDRVIFVDTTFVPVIAAIQDQLPSDLKIIVMTDEDHMPESDLPLGCYEDLLAPQAANFDWPELPEDTAAGLCYTSGTTGNPKGALFPSLNRIACLFRGRGRGRDVVRRRACFARVPLFHVNAWGFPIPRRWLVRPSFSQAVHWMGIPVQTHGC